MVERTPKVFTELHHAKWGEILHVDPGLGTVFFHCSSIADSSSAQRRLDFLFYNERKN